ncbi:transposase [Roseateles sp.]|uniref:transposase n=1 Tax=Roseateles sp. TaxID=1971397 RepID=UPI0039EC19D7
MNTSLISERDPEDQPLCRSYVSVLFNPISARVSGKADTHPMPMLWAIGVLYDGQPDYLGSWVASGPKDSQWLAIAEDLKARGVERIRFIIGPSPTEMQAAVTARCCTGNWHCTALPISRMAIAPSVIDALLPGHRPYIERVLEVATPLGARLKRALARHGSFASAAAAAALLRQSTKRYINAKWPEPETVPAPPLRAQHATTG